MSVIKTPPASCSSQSRSGRCFFRLIFKLISLFLLYKLVKGCCLLATIAGLLVVGLIVCKLKKKCRSAKLQRIAAAVQRGEISPETADAMVADSGCGSSVSASGCKFSGWCSSFTTVPTTAACSSTPPLSASSSSFSSCCSFFSSSCCPSTSDSKLKEHQEKCKRKLRSIKRSVRDAILTFVVWLDEDSDSDSDSDSESARQREETGDVNRSRGTLLASADTSSNSCPAPSSKIHQQ